jgi:trehalose 6-phosphate phosphatase
VTCRSRSTSGTTTPSRSAEPDPLRPLRERADRAGILLDFDGTLAEIVDHPDLAVPIAGVREALVALVERYRLVAVVTGRRSEEVAERLSVPGMLLYGLYGMQELAPELAALVRPRAEVAAAVVPEAWVEDKGVSVAVHYRQASDPVAARAALLVALRPVAAGAGLDVVEGKMVLELVPVDRPMKGGAVERLAGEHALEAVLFAGDDVVDVDAFRALDRLEGRGVLGVRVGVRGAEAPAELLERADLVVDGPTGLLGLLRGLV